MFLLRDGKLIGRIILSESGQRRYPVTSIVQFCKAVYAGTPFIPGEITLQTEIEDADVIEEWLTSRRKQKVRIVVPKKGTKEKLVELAWENARMVLEKDRERIQGKKAERSERFMKWKIGLGLKVLIEWKLLISLISVDLSP